MYSQFKIALVASLAFSSLAFANLDPLPKEIFEPPAKNYPSKTYGKVAVVQWAPSQATPLGATAKEAETFKQSNREVLADYVTEAAKNGAKLILTPEFSIVGYPDIPDLPPEEDEYRDRADIEPYVETVPGPSTNYFGKLAKKLGVYIHIGFAEVDSKTDKYYNVVVVLGPDGSVVTKFRKINLYMGETNFLSPGSSAVSYANEFFGEVGLAICADIYSSKPMATYKKNKVGVVALSTSWAQWNTGMDTFSGAADDNSAYVLASNQNYFPDSGVINPDGSLQSHIRQSDGVAYGYLPLK